MSLSNTVALAATAIAALALSWVIGRWSLSWGVNDAPDEVRKKQSQPVPRLGGVSIFLGAGFAALIAAMFGLFSFSLPIDVQPWGLITALCGGLFLIGLWDDIWGANTKLKLIAMLCACAAAARFGLSPETLTSPFGSMQMTSILVIGSALWMLVFVNAANFMDGSNGLAVGCLTVMFTGLMLAASDQGDFTLTPFWFALLGAMAGFLIHNLRGKLYVGDAGALGLGALFSGLGLVSGLEVWTVATLALPFLVDVLLTLIWRAKHGRSWLQAHRDHTYQKLIDRGWSHFETAFLYWALCIGCAIAAIIAAKAGGAAPFTAFFALLIAGICLWLSARRN